MGAGQGIALLDWNIVLIAFRSSPFQGPDHGKINLLGLAPLPRLVDLHLE